MWGREVLAQANSTIPVAQKWRAIEMKEHETRRKVIRQWMKLPKDQRRTEEQAAAFAKVAVQQNKFEHSRREPYQKVVGWLLPRISRS